MKEYDEELRKICSEFGVPPQCLKNQESEEKPNIELELKKFKDKIKNKFGLK